MPIDFYALAGGPICRSVVMAAAAVGVELNLIPTNTLAGEQFAPEYVKMNPQHCIPTIKDGDFVLWESRAILCYLMNKYAKDDTYYPKDPQKRAVVDQRLYFDMGVLSQRFGDYWYPQLLQGKPADPEKLTKMEEGVEFLNTFLANSKYVAGETVTIADMAVLANISHYVEGGANFSLEKYPNVQRWFRDAKENVPGYQATVEGMAQLKAMLFDKFYNKA